MASDWHEIVKEIVKQIIKDFDTISSKGYHSIEFENIIKLTDPTPHSKAVIEYDPDAVIKRNISEHTYYQIVFEVVSDQEDVKTMADIARISACREIKKAIFLSTTTKKFDETNRIVDTLTGLYKKRFRKSQKDNVVDIISLEILKEDSKDRIRDVIIDNIKDILPKNKKNPNE